MFWSSVQYLVAHLEWAPERAPANVLGTSVTCTPANGRVPVCGTRQGMLGIDVGDVCPHHEKQHRHQPVHVQQARQARLVLHIAGHHAPQRVQARPANLMNRHQSPKGNGTGVVWSQAVGRVSASPRVALGVTHDCRSAVLHKHSHHLQRQAVQAHRRSDSAPLHIALLNNQGYVAG